MVERIHKNRLSYEKIDKGIYKINGVIYITEKAMAKGLIQIYTEENDPNRQ